MVKTTRVLCAAGAICAATVASAQTAEPGATQTPNPPPIVTVEPATPPLLVLPPAPQGTAVPTTPPAATVPDDAPVAVVPSRAPQEREREREREPEPTRERTQGATPAPEATPKTGRAPVAIPPTASPPRSEPPAKAVAVPAPAIAPSPRTPAGTGAIDWWPWALGAIGLALLALLWSRYRRDEPEATTDDPVAQAEAAPAAAPVQPMDGARLALSLRPVRAGLNMVTAVADCEITIHNEGTAAAEDVRPTLTLHAAQGGQGAAIAAADAEPISRSMAPPFTLQPGEARTLRGFASANINALPTMQAGGRDMLVPLVLLNVRHRDGDGGEHRTSQGFVVGVERVDSAKLAPFWLDTIRMVEQVAARPAGAAERGRVA